VVKKIFFFVLSLLLAYNFLSAASPLETKGAGAAHDFTLFDLDSREVSLSDFKGKPTILFFWTTWCPYCREELKQLNTMQLELSKNNTQVLAINVEEPAEKVQRFILNNPVRYKVLLDKDATVSEDYGILGVPTYVFIDKERRVASYSHYFSPNKYKNIISK